ncbi:Sterol biosynthesis regulatory protein, putative [Candida maltosa Xu316]|uniref:Sterol biosynthesis regulatory protein, putative n=1 Tax=Candida maltosa (strain Xu316) TaxID=1245528 RepID=M3J5C1_CANMX|nr:Sterol biosynthesis regulatory protein, putative [Candida maltosa Xu316]
MSIRRSAINRNATEEEGGPIQSPSVLNLTQPELYGIYNNDENISKEFVEDSSEIEKIKTRDLNHGAKSSSK